MQPFNFSLFCFECVCKIRRGGGGGWKLLAKRLNLYLKNLKAPLVSQIRGWVRFVYYFIIVPSKLHTDVWTVSTFQLLKIEKRKRERAVLFVSDQLKRTGRCFVSFQTPSWHAACAVQVTIHLRPVQCVWQQPHHIQFLALSRAEVANRVEVCQAVLVYGIEKNGLHLYHFPFSLSSLMTMKLCVAIFYSICPCQDTKVSKL